MRRTRVYLLVVCSILAAAAAGLGSETPKAAPATRLVRVALFKNGVGFFVRQGSLPAGAETAVLGPYAAPSHGTLWVSAPSRLSLASVVAREMTIEQEVEARSILELLHANVGREVKLGSPSDYGAPEGVILGFESGRASAPQQLSAYQMGALRRGEVARDGTGGYMLLRTRVGTLAVSPSNYGRVTFLGDDVETTYVRETPAFELRASFGAPAVHDDWIAVTYLAKGVTWAPSYLLDLSEDDTADLSAKAVIVNEAEDIEGAHVDLVTGFPNLQYSDIASPMARKETLASFLNALSRGRSQVEESVMTQAVGFDVRGGVTGGRGGGMGGIGGGPMPGYGAAVAGREAEDLFLYPLEDITLGTGETGYYPLFTETVPYTEIYQWAIPDYVGERDRYLDPGQVGETERVWHSVRLENETHLPWTTAPVQLMRDGQIVAQDTLGYTPPDGEATVRITRAVSVRAEQEEVEVSRERDVIHLYGDSFDRVTIEGTLKVTNYKSEPIALEITKLLSGEVKDISPSAEDVTLAEGLARMNPHHRLTWKLDLKPGDAREVTYRYEALIRR